MKIKDFIEKISFSRTGQTGKITLSQIRNMVSYIDKHREVFLVLLKNGYLRDKYIEEWKIKLMEKNISKEEIKLSLTIIQYSVDGICSILKKWTSYELDIPYQELILIIYQLIEGSVWAKRNLMK